MSSHGHLICADVPRVIAVIYWLNIEGICPDVIFFSSQDLLNEIADDED